MSFEQIPHGVYTERSECIRNDSGGRCALY